MSPSPAITIPTPSAFTDEQKAFIGPHHEPKILGEKTVNQPQGDSNEPLNIWFL